MKVNGSETRTLGSNIFLDFCQPAYSRLSAYGVIFFDGLTDIFLISLPVPVIWKSRLPLKQRVMLAGLFSGGFMIVVFAILRCVYMLGVSSLNIDFLEITTKLIKNRPPPTAQPKWESSPSANPSSPSPSTTSP